MHEREPRRRVVVTMTRGQAVPVRRGAPLRYERLGGLALEDGAATAATEGERHEATPRPEGPAAPDAIPQAVAAAQVALNEPAP